MGLASSSGEPSSDGALGLANETWGKIGIIAALFAALFWPNLRRLWEKTNPFTGEANWQHAILVPIVGIYYLYIHREELLKTPAEGFIYDRFTRPGRLYVSLSLIAVGALSFLIVSRVIHVPFLDGTAVAIISTLGEGAGILGLLGLLLDWSLATTLFGIAVYIYGIYPGRNDYVKDLGMLVTLFGICLLICGREVMKIAWFPIAFLICALPWPGLVYSWVAGPLQVMAAHAAVDVLKLTGVDAGTSGTKIVIAGTNGGPNRMLNVAEACAGMRSLMTFISVGGAIAFLSARPLWQKIIITISSIPIAIFCNVMRVSGQGLLDHYVSEKLSESFAHQFVGMIMLVPAFFLILGVGWVLDHVFIEEVDDSVAELAAKAAAPPLTIIMPKTAPAPVATAKPAPIAKPTPVAKPAPVAPVQPVEPAPRVVPIPPPPVGRTVATPPRPGGANGLTPSRQKLNGAPGARPASGGIVPPKMPTPKTAEEK